MAGKSPFDKYNDTSTRVNSSISTGYSSQTAVQPKYSHPPTSPPNYETTKPHLVWSNDNPRPNAKTNPTTRIPLALRLTGLGLGMFVGSKIYETFSNNPEALDESIIFGKDYKEPTPEEKVNNLTKEIQKYNPDFTFSHKKDMKGVQYLANQLHYEKVRYYNLHKHSCRSGYDLNLYTKTVRDLDAQVDFENALNSLPGRGKDIDLQEDINKKAYEDYKANGGELSYNDWLMTTLGKGDSASHEITYNSNIKTHISTVDGFSQKKGVIGGHNMDAFNQAVTDKNLKIVSSTDHPTIKGLKQVEYQIPSFDRAGNSTGYKNKIFTKTIYDPKVISDNKILELGKQATAKGYTGATSQGLSQYSSEAGGINFRVYIRNDIIDNYHPEF